jgi:hypothetical protein
VFIDLHNLCETMRKRCAYIQIFRINYHISCVGR